MDVSTDFVSPSTIQDPAYVSYNEDSKRIKFDQESGVEHVRRYGVLEKLNSIMFGYGCHEDSHNGVAFPTFAKSGTEFKNFPMTAILSAKANY